MIVQVQFGNTNRSRFHDVSIGEAKIQRKDRIFSLVAVCNAIPIRKKKKSVINLVIVFHRFTALAEKEENVQKHFPYNELAVILKEDGKDIVKEAIKEHQHHLL